MIDALAQEARRACREAQLVLDGQLTYGGATPEWPHPKTRFSLVARINRALKDPQSTYALFASLDTTRLSAELGNFAKDLRLRTAILRGSGCRANWPHPAPCARRSSPIRWRRTPGAHVLIEPDKKAEQPIWKPSA
jgi:hypothetical protein